MSEETYKIYSHILDTILSAWFISNIFIVWLLPFYNIIINFAFIICVITAYAVTHFWLLVPKEYDGMLP